MSDGYDGDMTKTIKLTSDAQRSIVECDIADGWSMDEDTADMASAVSAHYAAHGTLLVVDAGRMASELVDMGNGFDDEGEGVLRNAAFTLAKKVRALA